MNKLICSMFAASLCICSYSAVAVTTAADAATGMGSKDTSLQAKPPGGTNKKSTHKAIPHRNRTHPNNNVTKKPGSVSKPSTSNIVPSTPVNPHTDLNGNTPEAQRRHLPPITLTPSSRGNGSLSGNSTATPNSDINANNSIDYNVSNSTATPNSNANRSANSNTTGSNGSNTGDNGSTAGTHGH